MKKKDTAQPQPDKKDDLHFNPSSEPLKNEPTPEKAREQKSKIAVKK